MPIENPTQLLRIALIVFVCFLSVLLGSMLPSGDVRLPIFAVTASILVVGVWLFPAWMTLLCIVFTMLPGRSGFGIGYVELLAFSLIARWLLLVPFRGDLFGKLTGKFTFICIAGFSCILIFHSAPAWLGDGAGRRLFFLAFATMLFSYAILAGKVNSSAFSWLPWFGLVPGLIATVFEVINLLFPASLPITYFIYTSQNWEAVAEYGGAQLDFVRLSGLRELGLGLGFLSLSYFAVDRGLTLGRSALQVSATAFGAILILLAGYRGFIIRLIFGTLVACFCRSKQTFLIACLSGAILLGGLIYTQNYIVSLPLSVQRSLSFLPTAEWDWRTKESADYGVGWRADIRRIYFTQIFPSSWIFGRGQTQSGEVENMSWMLNDARFQTEYFVLSQSYHSGLVSSLDYVGVAGTSLLIIGMLRGIANCCYIFKYRSRAKPWQIWLILYFTTVIPVFWYTGFFNSSFPFFAIFLSLLEVARREIGSGETHNTRSGMSVLTHSAEVTRQ